MPVHLPAYPDTSLVWLTEFLFPQCGNHKSLLLYAEHFDVSLLVEKKKLYESFLSNIAEGEEIVADGSDSEMIEMARLQIEEAKEEISVLEEEIRVLLIPKDPEDSKNVVMELRAGTGGDEASIFAGDLFRMYTKYCEGKGWKVSVVDMSEGTAGGFKEVIFEVSGNDDVYGLLKFESGVHRVQRVPQTETQGRVHTSAATVMVLPEAEEFDVEINMNDVRIDYFCSSGPGGQSVNTTDSAVRITHLPSGLVVTQQDEKSQHKNRAKAMKVLRARLYEEERFKQQQERAADRSSQVGSGDRSERIRTYNFPQGRVTDHRINLTLHKLEEFLEGEVFDEMIESLTLQAQEESLSNL